MGNRYANVTVAGPTRDNVVDALRKDGVRAFVSPCENGVTSVAEAKCDDLDPRYIDRFAAGLSKALQCTALWVLNDDDNLLRYALFADGALDHRFSSSPYEAAGFLFRKSIAAEPADADALHRAFGERGDRAELDRVFGKSDAGALVAAGDPDAIEKGYVFAFERHEDMLAALGLPSHGVCFGYRYAAAGDLPPGLRAEDLVRI